VESAVADAWQNAREHGVHNVRFVQGDLLKTMSAVEPRPDVIVTDPPRSGMHEKVLRLINDMRPKRMVYVSCNPTTLARDLKILSERFEVEEVQPVDMFPQTYHIETVVKLKRRDS
ncbi:23S rRNA (uracil(1939)-C(5))-methyltransferase RlmD, partial [candidate division KSB1 bacterium]